ncbi:MAG: aspartate carbamoyltransferase catalytic subunit [Deltaproteobacteria bacterium]|nr:aspartate carbamoyltransferase catalytic subunit [Deltaproteobacteria bacterium]MBW1846793.1 aspartate carbamoyltransferase catalytic subunit [Deltaproteobacteria bacterium]MBW2181476.1 aspartate carbamoyltransferase catalytic subunit [Deltaproteobacteria bacterium]MBW2365399.1 aspartate carbamoyltransferase catalytic subunit [Deltaproteobacteria bacterium]
MQFARKHILDMESLSVEEINVILDTAERMKEISKRPVKKVPTLRGKTVVLFFYEPSTRTRTSFDIAAKRLSADSLTLSGSSSSIVKGETLLDTARTLEAMNPDAVIIRHSSAGAPHMLSKMTTIPIINAGDGMHAHPTQSLLDLMTVVEKKGKVSGLNIAIIGDISHSRVARSNCIGFKKLGAHITLAGPPTMIPKGIESLGASVTYHAEEAIQNADVIMMLRIQKERQKSYLFPSEREYAKVYGLTKEKLKKAKADVLIMHPGPVNRGVEIAPEVADGPYSIILDQVTNGVAVRMAILYLIVGGARDATAD